MDVMRRRRRRIQAPAGRGLAIVALVGALAVGGCQDATSLTGPTWQWTAQVDVDASRQSSIADPAHYTIEFRDDGMVTVTADCNTLSGSFEIGVPLDLAIRLESPSLDDCGADSLGRDYLEDLGRVTTYATDDGALLLFFGDEVGGMRFDRS